MYGFLCVCVGWFVHEGRCYYRFQCDCWVGYAYVFVRECAWHYYMYFCACNAAKVLWSSVLNTSTWVWGIYFIIGVVCNAVLSGPGTLRVRVGASSLASVAQEIGVFMVGASLTCGL